MASRPPSAPNSGTERFWAGLGLQRFFLASIVAGSHLRIGFPNTSGHLDLIHLLDGLNAFAAIIGFLMISGFSIAHSLENEAAGYYWRRLTRIYPLYFFALLFSLWVGRSDFFPSPVHAGDSPQTTFEVIGNFFLLQGFVARPLWQNQVVWTLSIECFFYVIAPLLRRLPLRTLAGLLAFFTLISFSWITDGESLFKSIPRSNYGAGVVFIGWAWLLGFWFYRSDRGSLPVAALVALPIFVTCINREEIGGRHEIPLLTSSLMLALGAGIAWPRVLLRPFRRLGDWSYALYLLHVPCISYVILHHLSLSPLACYGVSVATAVVAVTCYELPVRRFLTQRRRG